VSFSASGKIEFYFYLSCLFLFNVLVLSVEEWWFRMGSKGEWYSGSPHKREDFLEALKYQQPQKT
jgi:hypothetical protein